MIIDSRLFARKNILERFEMEEPGKDSIPVEGRSVLLLGFSAILLTLLDRQQDPPLGLFHAAQIRSRRKPGGSRFCRAKFITEG